MGVLGERWLQKDTHFLSRCSSVTEQTRGSYLAGQIDLSSLIYMELSSQVPDPRHVAQHFKEQVVTKMNSLYGQPILIPEVSKSDILSRQKVPFGVMD